MRGAGWLSIHLDFAYLDRMRLFQVVAKSGTRGSQIKSFGYRQPLDFSTPTTMDASLLALSAALGGNSSSASKKMKSKGKGKGKGKAKKTSSPSAAAAPAADLMKVLAATVKAVDGHTASISKTDEEMAAMKQTMESLSLIHI